jgi:hypothetical protein
MSFTVVPIHNLNPVEVRRHSISCAWRRKPTLCCLKFSTSWQRCHSNNDLFPASFFHAGRRTPSVVVAGGKHVRKPHEALDRGGPARHRAGANDGIGYLDHAMKWSTCVVLWLIVARSPSPISQQREGNAHISLGSESGYAVCLRQCGSLSSRVSILRGTTGPGSPVEGAVVLGRWLIPWHPQTIADGPHARGNWCRHQGERRSIVEHSHRGLAGPKQAHSAD